MTELKRVGIGQYRDISRKMWNWLVEDNVESLTLHKEGIE